MNHRASSLSVALVALVLACPSGLRGSSVEAAAKPAGPWKSYATRTLADLPVSVTGKVDDGLDEFGGRPSHATKVTGYFHPEKIGDRWWLVDPAGGLFIHQGVVTVAPLRTVGAQAAFTAKFGDASRWAEQTTAWLRENHFNGTGAWSDTDALAAVASPLAYTRMWNFMSSYGKQRGGTFQQPGHTGYPKDCIFVFDPGFETFCDEHAKQLAATKDDPHLLGHFSDKELPFKREALANYLSLPESDPGHAAATKFLRERHGASATPKDITEQDQQEFLALVVDRYLGIVGRAIRKYDPHHLFIGSRFHGAALRFPEVFRAAGPHLDVISVNYYNAWTPAPERLAMWEHESGRPSLITEWYVKAMDSGLGNTTGAGWVVKTQAERGQFYENFTLGLLESKVCVGWHWFKYMDNDPANTKTDASNRDSNKGILNARYEPYTPLLDAMRELNSRIHPLIQSFDSVPTSK
jgi:hypothetical protein